MKHYPSTTSDPDFSLLDSEIIKFEKENKVFDMSKKVSKIILLV